MERTLSFLAVLACSAPAWSGALNDEYLRLGGGFGTVSIEGTQHGTLQAFAGVDTVRQGPWRAGVEVSAMEVSESNRDGLGVSGLFSWSAAEDVNFFARAGADFGGDAGWLLGGGIGYFIERNMEVRLEMVSRPHGSGLQFNLAYYPRLRSW